MNLNIFTFSGNLELQNMIGIDSLLMSGKNGAREASGNFPPSESMMITRQNFHWNCHGESSVCLLILVKLFLIVSWVAALQHLPQFRRIDNILALNLKRNMSN